MPKIELTKKLLARTLKDLAKTKPMDKISISEIAEAAGLNRQTFYYHFQDKQELICWIFDTEMKEFIGAYEDDQSLKDVIEHLYQEKAFYMNALASTGQNSLREHIYELCYQRCVKKLLALAKNRTLEEEPLVLFAKFFTHAIVGSMVQWVLEGTEDSVKFIEEHVSMLDELMAFVVEKNVQ